MASTVKQRKEILMELQTIPGIGNACALDLWNIGIRNVSDLKDQNPRLLYEKLNSYSNLTHDVCMLYTFRCAVYYASEVRHDKQKLSWWYWKDKSYNE